MRAVDRVVDAIRTADGMVYSVRTQVGVTGKVLECGLRQGYAVTAARSAGLAW